MQRRRLLLPALFLSCSSKNANASENLRLSIPMNEGGRTRPRVQATAPQYQYRQQNEHVALHPTYRRLSTASECISNQHLFLLNFQTDSYGSETSWFLRSKGGDYIGYGPPAGISYGDFKLYSFSYCLDVGSTYTLALEDNFGDGMCCSRGFGGYEYYIGGVRIYSTNLLHTFTDYVEHTFTVEDQYTPSPTISPTEEPMMDMVCVSNPAECGCDDINQEDYRGTISTTEDGIECQAWNAMTPHQHEDTPSAYPYHDLTENYCRSPTGGIPWCYTTDPNVEWGYCRIPSCPTETMVTSEGRQSNMPTTVEDIPTKSPVTQAPVTSEPSGSPTFTPTYEPTPQPTPQPTRGRSVYNPDNGCYGGDVKVQIEVGADEFSTDTSWELSYPNGTRIMHQAEGSFAPFEYKTKQVCLPHGNYTFIIQDKYGDGMCCRYGEGFFRVHLDGREVVVGGSYNENVTATINVGFTPNGYMTERELDYLESHNVRRKDWHERNNLTYVPLVYSPGLARTAKAWAEELLNSCQIVGAEHESFNPYGENLAKNTGNPETWGQLYPVDNIVGRWVEFEIGLPYPSNGHLTQALWRATQYLGCGESVRKFRSGVCRVQVCRYGRAGNCDMEHYNATEGENWLQPMLLNYTRCGPDCSPDGCF